MQSSYRAPWWLPEGHSQTIFPALFTPKPNVSYLRERWDTPDGDFVDVDWVASTKARSGAPLVVLFHGLEGNSNSHYARALMHACEQRGWRGAVYHFRGCSGEPNRLARAYHSGDSAEIAWALGSFKDSYASNTKMHVAGVSLGGNALGKHLGEARQTAVVNAATVISAPIDLHAGAVALSRGFNMNYTRNFLKTLKEKHSAKALRFKHSVDLKKVLASRDFFDFDELVTAPLHGFASAMDYWTRSSCGPFLKHIAIPTLVLNAKNDPFLPAQHLPSTSTVSNSVTLEQPEHGGHVGFATGTPPGNHSWLSQRIVDFFAQHG